MGKVSEKIMTKSRLTEKVAERCDPKESKISVRYASCTIQNYVIHLTTLDGLTKILINQLNINLWCRHEMGR